MINANLLPPEIKEEIAQSKKNKRSVLYIWWAAIIFIVVVVITGGMYYFLNTNLDEASTNLQTREQSEKKYGTLEEKAKKLAERITAIKAINDKTNKWSSVITEVQAVMPAGAYLTSVKIDSSAKVRDQISGYAKSKQEVASLRDAMEKSDKFEYVDIESSTTEKEPQTMREVENFTISFSLSKGALQ